MLKPNLSSLYIQIKVYRRDEKENFILKKLMVPKKTQEINNPRKLNKKSDNPHYINKMTGMTKHCLLITQLMILTPSKNTD